MYAADTVIQRVQEQIRSKKLIQKEVLEKCGIAENTLKKMTDNKGISSFYLAKIADELDCSVDFLLGRTDNKQSHYSTAVTTGDISLSHNSVVGDGHVGVQIHNGADVGGQAEALVKIFGQLEPVKQAKLLVYADKLREGEE